MCGLVQNFEFIINKWKLFILLLIQVFLICFGFICDELYVVCYDSDGFDGVVRNV